MNKPDSGFKLRSYENGIVLMLFFTFGFLFMDRLSITFLFPFIKEDLHLSDTQIGMLVSVLAITWALSGYFFSSVADFIGSRKKVLVPATIAFSLFSVFSGLARNFYVLFIARGLMGLSEGPILPLAQATAAEESTPKRRGLNTGFLQSASQLMGAFITPLVVVAIAVNYSWNVAFYILGIPGLIMAFLLWKFMKDRKGSASQENKEKKKEQTVSWEDYRKVFKQRNVWLCVLISACFMTWLFAYSTFAPDFFVATGYTKGQMSVIMSGIGLGSFMWMILVPMISDKLGRKPTFIIFSLLAVVSPVIFAMFHFPVWVMFLIAVFATTGNGLFPLFMVVIPSEAISIGVITTAIGLVQLIGELIGGAVMPTVAGLASDGFGIAAPLWIAAGGAFIAAIIGFGLKETAPVKLQKRETPASNGENLGVN